MSFLAPLFLVGALAVALPVIFHLIRRTTRERTVFSSLLFLTPTPPRLTRRSRLENLLLLALRCSAIALLAAGFARPYLKRPINSGTPSENRRTLVLLDTSASMRRSTLWAEACAKAEAALRDASPNDQLALYAFDRHVRAALDFDQWKAAPPGDRLALGLSRLKSLSPGWASTQLGQALIRAAEILADNSGSVGAERKRIVVITDFQEGSHLEPLQGYEWPKGIELSLEILKTPRTSNASLQRVADPEELTPQGQGTIRVRVSNCPDSRREQFQVGWLSAQGHGFAGKPWEVYVPPGQSRILALPLPRSESATNVITLAGDDEAFDNSIFVIPPEPIKVRVLYLGLDTDQDARQLLYFLRRAFQQTRRQDVELQAHSPAGPLLETEIESAGLIVVADALSEPAAQALHDQVLAGKTVLAVLKNASAAPTLERVLGVRSVAIEEASPRQYAMLADIDFRHPLFAPFADPRFSDFTKVHFWKYRRLDPTPLPTARILAKFDSGDPAILEFPMGKGHVFLMTSGWRPDDSQLALSTKFVPLLYSFLDQTGLPDSAPLEYHVGDTVPLAVLSGAEAIPLKLQVPDGSELNFGTGETNFSGTMVPGVYRLLSSQRPKAFAVNLDPAESRTAPAAADELERLGSPVVQRPRTIVAPAERAVRLQNAELESRQKLWRWLILTVMLVLVIETWLAGRTARQAGVASPT